MSIFATFHGGYNSRVIIEHLCFVARLFLISRMDDTKYIPIISDRKSTTLLDELLPPPDTAKKNCTNHKINPYFSDGSNSVQDQKPYFQQHKVRTAQTSP
jgi:hypothetical protein